MFVKRDTNVPKPRSEETEDVGATASDVSFNTDGYEKSASEYCRVFYSLFSFKNNDQ